MVAISFYQTRGIDVTFDFPTEWNELLPQELEAISRVQLTEMESAGQDKVEILKALLSSRAKSSGKKLPVDFFERLAIDDVTTTGIDLINFLYEQNSLTKQPYQTLQKWMGPADDFNNLTVGEYEDCEIFFNQFKLEPGQDPLCKLAAVLYRPAGIRYLPWNAATNSYDHYDIDKVLPLFLKIDGAILYTIFTWYCGCRNRLPQYFPTLFKSDGSAADDEPDFTAFTKCIHGAAGPKNGSREKVRTLLLKELLFDLEQEAIKVEEYKKQVERMKP